MTTTGELVMSEDALEAVITTLPNEVSSTSRCHIASESCEIMLNSPILTKPHLHCRRRTARSSPSSRATGQTLRRRRPTCLRCVPGSIKCAGHLVVDELAAPRVTCALS